MKSLIRILLREQLLDEAAKTINDLPEDAALFINQTNSSFRLTLYSKELDQILGVITASLFGNIFSHSNGVAAESGYGPLIYELMMGCVYPRYLMPSRDGDIREVAWNVWTFFYFNRKDIIKMELDFNSPIYSFNIIDHYGNQTPEENKQSFNELSLEEQKDITIFNTAFKINQPIDVTKMIANSKKVEMTTELSVRFRDYFIQKYD